MNEYKAKRVAGRLPDEENWKNVEPIILVDSTNGREIENKCEAQILWNEKNLFVKFDCKDDHIWGTYKNDDDPIYNEEVVEIFIAKGEGVPKEYFEFQFSPCGVKFDAKIQNPTGDRKDEGFAVDKDWNCEGLNFGQKFEIDSITDDYKSGRWTTYIQIPAEIFGGAKKGDIFRANLFRIDGWSRQDSFQSWVPTMQNPANFHVPDKFGKIELVDS